MAKTIRVEQQGGIGFVGLLTLLFVSAKLFGFIDWSWWWVFSPMLITTAVVAVILGGLGLLVLGAYLWDEYDNRQRIKKLTNERNRR